MTQAGLCWRRLSSKIRDNQQLHHSLHMLAALAFCNNCFRMQSSIACITLSFCTCQYCHQHRCVHLDCHDASSSPCKVHQCCRQRITILLISLINALFYLGFGCYIFFTNVYIFNNLHCTSVIHTAYCVSCIEYYVW